jgi:hypothetical protein
MYAGYVVGELISALEQRSIVPHVTERESGIAQRGECSPGRMPARMRRILPSYQECQRRRKMIEEVPGWMKMVGLLRCVRHVGQKRLAQVMEMTVAANNPVWVSSLLAAFAAKNHGGNRSSKRPACGDGREPNYPLSNG